MRVNFTIKDTEVLLRVLQGPSAIDPEAAKLYERLKRIRDEARFKRKRLDPHADAVLREG